MHLKPQLAKPRLVQTGFLLLEVLVSLMIGAIGMLALAGVHATSLRHGKLSQHRALATQLAQDMAERLRANKGQAGQGAYDFNQSFGVQAGAVPPWSGSCNSAAQSCDALQIAQADMAQWRQRVRASLPEGSVHLLRAAGPLAADVWVAWREPERAADETLRAANECPASLLPGSGTGVRCTYLRVHL